MLFRLFYITWDYDIDWEKLRPDFKSNVFRLCRENSRPSLSINFIMISKVLLEKFLIYCDRKSSILYCTSHSIISRISFIQDDEQYRKIIIGLLLRAKRQFYFSLEISTFKDICILLTDLLYSNFSMILLNTLFDVKMNDRSLYKMKINKLETEINYYNGVDDSYITVYNQLVFNPSSLNFVIYFMYL